MKKLITPIVILVMALFGMPVAAAQAATPGWYTWEVTTGLTKDGSVTYPQKLVGVGKIAPPCGKVYQQDDYSKAKAEDIEKVIKDGVLTHGEDFGIIQGGSWNVVSGGDCKPVEVKVTKTFQVDTYLNPTQKLANKTAGYDNDGKLKWGEDKAHYGHSKYQTVKVVGLKSWTTAQWVTAINKATTKSGVGNVSKTTHVGKVRKGQKITTAWEIHGSWRKNPQTFFARS